MKHTVNFVCNRCDEVNKIRNIKKGDILSCSSCGNKVCPEAKNRTFVSFTGVEKDDLGEYIIVSQQAGNRVTSCTDCEKKADINDKVYIEDRGRYRANRVKCESCKKKDIIADGLETDDDVIL